jgi:hypothetical protein
MAEVTAHRLGHGPVALTPLGRGRLSANEEGDTMKGRAISAVLVLVMALA